MSRHHALIASLLLTLAVASCSGSAPSAGAAASATPAAAAAVTPAAHDGRKVDITADDTMKYSTVELRATTGERLSLTLVNKGTTPKFSMGHNWILLTAAADVDGFLLAATEAATTDYVPASKRPDIVAATKLLGPAEQDTTTFNAPSQPGRYPFLCSFPGHAQGGMRGVLIVE